MTPPRLLWAVLLACGLCPVQAALAQPTADELERAGELFAQGVAQFREQEYQAALASFQLAYRTAPNYRVLYNIGSTGLLLEEHVIALEAFQRYLSEGSDRIPAARRQQIADQIRRLEQQVVRLRITTNVTGATILLDGQEVGQTPLGEVLTIEPGRHELLARKEGLPPARQVLDAAPGERHALHLTLIVQPSSEEAAPALRSAAPASGRRWTDLWISAGVTGLLAVATGVLGALTLQSQKDLDHELAQYPASPGAIEDTRERTQRLSWSTDALLGASILAAGVTVYFLIAGSRSAPEEASPTTGGLQLTPGPWGIQGRF